MECFKNCGFESEGFDRECFKNHGFENGGFEDKRGGVDGLMLDSAYGGPLLTAYRGRQVCLLPQN
jgi:hypothetical protein